MKAVTKYLTGAAAAAAMTVTAAAPAQAQIFGGSRDRGGIDAGDIITGVAVVGGIAAILSALGRDGRTSGYETAYGYRDNYQNAVNSCGYEAERYAQGGQVSVTEVDRRSNDRYRVRGVIDAAYANNNYGYGSYGQYGTRYDPRYDTRSGTRYDPRYDARYDRYGRANNTYGYGQRLEFSCTARSDGRVTDFDVDRI